MLCQVMYEQNGSVREDHMDCQIDTITRYMCGRRCRFNHLESRYDTTDNVSERTKGVPRIQVCKLTVVVDLKDLGEIVVEGREWSRRLSDLEDIALVSEVDFIFGIRIEFCYDN